MVYAQQQQQIVRMRSPTLILIFINSIIFLFQQAIPQITSLFDLVPSKILAGEVWRIFTSMFLHASWVHILFNMYALLIFGPLVEQRIGRKRFWLAYFVSGFIAALSYIAYMYVSGTPNVPALGASGAIMGILGLVIMLLPNLKVLFFFVVPMSMRTAGIVFAAMDFVGLFNPASHVAHIAHLGGLSVGILYGWYLIKKRKVFAESFTRTKMNFGSSRMGTAGTYSAKQKQQKTTPQKDYARTIELSKDDLDDYFKYGKL